MASSKSKARAQAQQRARAQAKKAAARTAPPVRATPTAGAITRTTRSAQPTAASAARLSPAHSQEQVLLESPPGPPKWFQYTTFVLAIIGLGISAYETYAHYNGSHLLGCSGGKGTFNCTAVITSAQSMVFNIFPVAVLGLAFYVVAVALFSPWGWRAALRVGRLRVAQHELGLLRLGSTIVGMGFVMYLIYAEVAQIGQICEYCTGVHIVTFILFCLTVVAAALWGLGSRRSASA